MEQTKRLVMTFKTTDDKKVSLSVDNPREDITESEIKDAMDLVVSKNIFAPNGADIVSAVEAKVAEILAAFEQVLNGMSALEGRIEEVEAKVAKIETEPAAEPVEDKPAESQTRMSRMDILKNLK